MNIGYAEFEKHMNRIVQVVEFENKLWELCSETYKNGLDCELTFPTLAEDVVSLLSAATGDKDEWIGYYVFELECGKKYKDGTITDADGSFIRLKTVKDLWDLLSTNSEKL